jgi:RND family efflux transporter MFP subunit
MSAGILLRLRNLSLFTLAMLISCAKTAPEESDAPSSDHAQQPITQESTMLSSTPMTDRQDSGFIGVIVAQHEVNVVAETEGRLATVDVHLGDRIGKGTRLATMDSREIQFELSSSQASLDAAQAALISSQSKAAQAHERLQRRKAHDTILSAEEMREVEIQVQVADADVEAAKARVRQLQSQVNSLAERLAKTTVRSPFEAFVTKRFVDPGAWISRGSSIVGVMSIENRVRFAAPAERIDQISLGCIVEVRVETATTEELLWAKVSHIAPQVDPASGMVFVEAALEGNAASPTGVRAGSVARVYMHETPRGSPPGL